MEFVLGLERHGWFVDHCITIAPELARVQQVAGYMDLRPFLAAKSIPFSVMTTYALKSVEDQERLRALQLDMILVMGWQRLLPPWLLVTDHEGATVHGSDIGSVCGAARIPRKVWENLPA